jgi:hypothetical protein
MHFFCIYERERKEREREKEKKKKKKKKSSEVINEKEETKKKWPVKLLFIYSSRISSIRE